MLVISHKPRSTHRRLYASPSSSAHPFIPPQQYQPTHRPPLSANTKCSVAPPSRLYSEAILSSDLHPPSAYTTPLHILYPTIQVGGGGGVPYICFPPKINRCCTGGIPSFSSTRSLMRETCGDISTAWFWGVCGVGKGRRRGKDLVVGFDVELDFFAC